jgi:putative phosphoribosyl transferase
MRPPYRNRRDAGRALAVALERFRGRPDLLVLGLPRGGVVVAYEIAQALGAPLDVLVVRKIGLPGAEEVAAGAVGPDGLTVFNPKIASLVAGDELRRLAEAARLEVARRQRLFRDGAPPLSVSGRCVLVVDDGIATGASTRAAVRVLRAMHPSEIVIATPVAAGDALAALHHEADQTICLATPEAFHSVGTWYDDFVQAEDRQVLALLHRARAIAEPRRRHVAEPSLDHVRIRAGDTLLDAELAIPPHPRAVVIVAQDGTIVPSLGAVGLATLRIELVPGPDGGNRRRDVRYDTPALTDRMVDVVDWAASHPALAGLPVGIHAASTVAAAGLAAAAARRPQVRAVVCRGGRPDLAATSLRRVHAPTLLVVGADDRSVLGFNRRAADLLPDGHVVTVPGAHHMFAEPGALEQANALARDWLVAHLLPPGDAVAASA